MKTKNALTKRVFLLPGIVSIYFIFGTPCIAQTRDEILQPEKVMDVIGIKEGMIIGELGAGKGYFTFKISNRVGNKGHVYANDIKEDVLEYIHERCHQLHVANITTILGKTDDPLFPQEKLDMVFMSYVFHMLEKPDELLGNIKASLKDGATLVILDVEPERIMRGPYPRNSNISEIAKGAGYELISKEDFIEGVDIFIFKVKE